MTNGAARRTAAGSAGAVGEAPAGPDPRSALISGLTTLAWYAVPDVVAPRWARALTKSAVLAGGVTLGVLATADGRSARAGLRELLSEVPQGPDGVAVVPEERDGDANGPVLGPEDAAPAEEVALGVNPVLAGTAVVGAVAAMAAIAVGGEKWAYRRGERWRARGLAWPHTRVGVLLGALAAGVTLLEPPRAVELDDGRLGAAVRPAAGRR